jgi:hypothetical protein
MSSFYLAIAATTWPLKPGTKKRFCSPHGFRWLSVSCSWPSNSFSHPFLAPVLPVKGVMESSYSVPNTPSFLPRTNWPRLIVQGRPCARMYSIQLFFQRHSINFKRQYDAHCFQVQERYIQNVTGFPMRCSGYC